jgi:hypothetical protein
LYHSKSLVANISTRYQLADFGVGAEPLSAAPLLVSVEVEAGAGVLAVPLAEEVVDVDAGVGLSLPPLDFLE